MRDSLIGERLKIIITITLFHHTDRILCARIFPYVPPLSVSCLCITCLHSSFFLLITTSPESQNLNPY